jgi:UDP-glucose 4-epimerase
VPHFILSSTAAVYGVPKVNPVTEDVRLEPISPYGSSKLMTEIMLRDTAKAPDLRSSRCVPAPTPRGGAGNRRPRATHLIKVAAEAALGQRPYLEVYGTDYPTPDARACATISTSAIWFVRISTRSAISGTAARARF